ncbi:hypothetical protein KKH39_02795 [Patescibacteria group bacterium]|nr:hypothetical protein [Patescibacteria group bacterium]
MKKNHFIYIFILLGLFFLSGCSKNKINNSETNTNIQPDNSWQENFDEVSVGEFVLGERVSVMGEENSEGSIVATSIILIPNGQEFQNFDPPDMVNNVPDQNKENFPTNNINNTDQPNFDRASRPDFQNMSEEERQARREQLMDSGATAGNVNRAGLGGNARINGEILSINDSGLTIKLADGGSKLVFFSSDTKFLAPKAISDIESQEVTEE